MGHTVRQEMQSGHSPAHISDISIVFLGLLSLLPLISAQFGAGNQLEQMPVILRLADPTYLQGDFFVDSASALGQPRFYYAAVIAFLNNWVELPHLFHGLSILTNFLLGYVTFKAAIRFFRASELGAAIAATLAVVNASFHLGFAGYLQFDSFQPADIAIPLAIAGLYLLLINRFFFAAFLGLLSSIFHPTIGAEITLLGFGAAGITALIRRNEAGFAGRLAKLIGAGMLFLLALFVVWGLPNIGAETSRISDEEFFSIIAQFRAPHHYLGLDFDTPGWIQAAFFLAVTGILAALHARLQPLCPTILTLWVAVGIVLILCAASLWFVDIQHSRLWVTAQIFRMFMVLKWVGFLYFGWAAGHWLQKPSLAALALVAAVVIASADANPYVAAIALAAWVTFNKLSISQTYQLMLCLPLLLAAALLQRKYGIDDQSLRAIAAISVAGALFVVPWKKPLAVASAVAVVVVSLAASVFMREDGILGIKDLRAQYNWSDLKQDEYDISRQAKAIGPADATWVIPPDLIVFYTLAQHPVIVNFSAIPFEDNAMAEWRGRLKTIYGPVSGSGFRARRNMEKAYRANPRLDVAATTYGASYAILFAETPWAGQVLAQNASYKAVKITAD